MHDFPIYAKSPISCSDQQEMLNTIKQKMLYTINDFVKVSSFFLWYEPRQGSTDQNGRFYAYKDPMFSKLKKFPIQLEKGLIINEMRVFTHTRQYHQVRQYDGTYSGVLWLFEHEKHEEDVIDITKLGKVTVQKDTRLLHPRLKSSEKSIPILKYYLNGSLIAWTIINDWTEGGFYV